ncbi:MAG: sucrose-specific PTS transporter subunit IIBC [Propionibacterium sp.]|jgi:PTS system sucrose-specific IIC component|nr:sucrose-specific PTS transporter subunit IIBC [Propionibacterium sp.]
MDHARVAQTVLQAVGGPDNITAAAHCATRLRLVLRDEQLIDHATLDEDPDVKGTFSAGGMFQIIIGPGDVDTVYESLTRSGVREVSKDEAKQVGGQKANVVIRFIKVLADVFVPILPALIAGGLMMALNNVLTAPGLVGPKSIVEMAPAITDVAAMINLFASAPFAFLPVLIGFSATKRFGGNPYLGAAMGAAMVMPALVNGWNVAAAVSDGTMTYWDLFGLQVAQAGYQGQVVPTLAVSFLLATTEKWLHRRLKGTVDFLLTPLITMIVTGFLAFVIVGPLTRSLGDGITFGLQWLYDSTGFLGGLLFGLVYSPIVVTGLHQSFPAVELSLIAQGGSFIFAIASMANVAQGAATLAVFLCAHEGKLKGLAGASAASALMGITEPAIFGVNLRLRWPFFIGIGSAAVGGALVSIFNVKAIALGAAGLLGFVSIRATDIPMFLLALGVTFALSFGITLTYARSRGKASLAGTHVDETVEQEEAEQAASDAALETAPISPVPLDGSVDLTITAPVNGELVALTDVKDPTFARGLLGPGAAVVPEGGPVVSPVDGVVIVAFPTGHAVGLRADSGVELLIHIGMDTVQLKGEHFASKVKVGTRVHRGQVLVEPEWDAIAAAGYDLTTPVVVTNAQKFGGVKAAASRPVEAGDEMLEVTQKDLALV